MIVRFSSSHSNAHELLRNNNKSRSPSDIKFDKESDNHDSRLTTIKIKSKVLRSACGSKLQLLALKSEDSIKSRLNLANTFVIGQLGKPRPCNFIVLLANDSTIISRDLLSELLEPAAAGSRLFLEHIYVFE